MPKKGRFAEDEKTFVKQNYLTMSDQQIAEILDRDKNAIVNFRRRHGLDKQGVATPAKGLNTEKVRDDFVQALPAEDQKKAFLAELRATSSFRTVSLTLTKDEIKFYEDKYIEFMMDPSIETMTVAEKDALHRKTIAEIRMYRFMEEEKVYKETGQPNNRNKEINECQAVIQQCEQSLKVTRQQRLKDGQDQAINFTAIIRELNNPRLRQALGYEAAMLKWMHEASYNDNIGTTISAGDEKKYDLGKNFVNPEDAKDFDSNFLGEEDDA